MPEEPRMLIARASFEAAQAVFEFGCGTGAFAEQVLLHSLPPQSTYLAVESSTTMVRLARSRLERFGACDGEADRWISPVERASWFL